MPVVRTVAILHDDVIKWKHFPRNWPFVRGFTGPGEFPTQRPVTRSFDVFFDLRLNKRSSKQPWGWWFETPSWPLWRQCNGFISEALIELKIFESRSPITLISFVKSFWNFAQSTAVYCRALYKISKRFDNWKIRYGQTIFREIWV